VHRILVLNSHGKGLGVGGPSVWGKPDFCQGPSAFRKFKLNRKSEYLSLLTTMRGLQRISSHEGFNLRPSWTILGVYTIILMTSVRYDLRLSNTFPLHL